MMLPSVSASPLGADVVVIGAGIVGTSCAYYLACEGLAVCLLDRAGIAGGTSGVGEGPAGRQVRAIDILSRVAAAAVPAPPDDEPAGDRRRLCITSVLRNGKRADHVLWVPGVAGHALLPIGAVSAARMARTPR